MPTVGLFIESSWWPRGRSCPGRWWYGSMDALRGSLSVADLHDVLVSDSLDALEAGAEADVPLGVWLLLTDRVSDCPEEALVSGVAVIATPFPRVARRVTARWPAYRERVHIIQLPRGHGEPVAQGERPNPLPADIRVSVWTGRGSPGAREAMALARAGCPLVAPRRGVLPDLVVWLGGAITEDRLGSDRELETLAHTAAGPLDAAVAVTAPSLYELVTSLYAALPSDPANLPAEWPPDVPPGGGDVRASRTVRRAHAALALESRFHVRDFEEGAEADRYSVSSRRRPRGVPALRSPRPTRVAACLMLGEPRATLIETIGSLAGAVDEVCVVHTAGRDPRVADLCGLLGLPLRERPLHGWADDFALARNASLELATAEYALVIDDDERLVGGPTLRHVLRHRVPETLRMPILNVQSRGTVLPQHHIRAVRLDTGIRFVGHVHETLEPIARSVTLVERPFIVHYGYADPDEVDRKVVARNRPLTVRLLAAGTRHHRLASVRLRDLLTEEPPCDPGALADAVGVFQAEIVEPGRWTEFVAWGPVFASALDRLGRGFRWEPDMPMPGWRGRHPFTLAFLRVIDFVRFLDAWQAETLSRLTGLADTLGAEPVGPELAAEAVGTARDTESVALLGLARRR